MSNILTSISFSTPDLDKASGPKLYWKLSSNISSKDLTRKASLSQYKCASCRPVSTSCRPVSNERSNRLWTRVHSPTSNQKYCIVLQFYGLINCKYCQIYYFSAPGACKILDLLKATSRGCLSPHTFQNLKRWNSVMPKFFQTERKTFMTFSH